MAGRPPRRGAGSTAWRCPVPDGSYTLVIRATDRIGNVTRLRTQRVIHFTVDNTSPPAPVSSAPFTVSGNATQLSTQVQTRARSRCRLVNPNAVAITVTALTVTLDSTSVPTGCDPSDVCDRSAELDHRRRAGSRAWLGDAAGPGREHGGDPDARHPRRPGRLPVGPPAAVVLGERAVMRGRLIRIGPIVAAVCVLVLAATAFAYFTSTGKGSVTGQTGSLSAPTGVTATPGSGTVSLSWNAVTPPASGTVTYYVTRNGAAAAGNCATSSAPTTATSCTDNGLAAGSYQYTVTAVWQTWSATSATANATVAQALDHFVLSAPSTATAGGSFTVTLTAKDVSGATVTSYTGSQSITFAGPPSSPNSTAPSYPATVSFTAGVGTASITLYDAGSSPLHATQGSTNSQSVSITVAPAAASTFTVQTPASPTAGSSFNETVTALDAYGNTATSYTGAQSLSFSGPASSPGANAPSYPASVTFTGGAGTATITLYDAQTTVLAATQGTVTGSSGAFTVSPAAASTFSMPTPSTKTAGTAFNETLTAVDSYGNTSTSYAGTKNVTFGGPASSPNANAPAYPVNVTFTAGAGTASITLYDAQTTTLGASQGSISGVTGSFTVAAASAATFSMPTPSTKTAGTAFNETLTALDAYGNTATGYAGAKSVTFSGPASSPGSNAPSYPATVTFSSGAGTASITLYDAQSTTLSASQGSIPGATGSFTVAPASAATFSMPTPSTKAAGTAFNETLTARDAYGNTATGYTGAQTVTFTGPATSPGANAPSYPATVTFASGAGTASITLYDAQSTTLTATQATVTGSSGSFTVTALAATQIAFTTQPSGATRRRAVHGPAGGRRARHVRQRAEHLQRHGDAHDQVRHGRLGRGAERLQRRAQRRGDDVLGLPDQPVGDRLPAQRERRHAERHQHGLQRRLRGQHRQRDRNRQLHADGPAGLHFVHVHDRRRRRRWRPGRRRRQGRHGQRHRHDPAQRDRDHVHGDRRRRRRRRHGRRRGHRRRERHRLLGWRARRRRPRHVRHRRRRRRRRRHVHLPEGVCRDDDRARGWRRWRRRAHQLRDGRQRRRRPDQQPGHQLLGRRWHQRRRRGRRRGLDADRRRVPVHGHADRRCGGHRGHLNGRRHLQRRCLRSRRHRLDHGHGQRPRRRRRRRRDGLGRRRWQRLRHLWRRRRRLGLHRRRQERLQQLHGHGQLGLQRRR